MQPGRLTVSLYTPEKKAVPSGGQYWTDDRFAKYQQAEAKHVRSRLKPATLGKPPGYTWPLWHQARQRDSYTGPDGPIRDWRYAKPGNHMGTGPAFVYTWKLWHEHATPVGPAASAPAPAAPASPTPRHARSPHDQAQDRRDTTAATAVGSPQPAERPTTQRSQTMANAPAAKPIDPRDVELAALRAENERLKAQSAKANTISIMLSKSGKACICVYGLGRFPVSLYRKQWLRLLAVADAIRKFITDNLAEIEAREEADAEAKAANAQAA